ncbi:MAG: tRNA (adenosine(37)-N6)-threonylcarbamoyltransferase complex dimerization subunit type 1 TsaB [Sphingomonadales bacterium]
MSIILLHLETSTKVCSVALSKDGALLAYSDQATDAYIHGEALTLMIHELLVQQAIQLHDLSAVSYSSGPGSYTGLRIGLSTAKGLCFALSIPLIALPTNQILYQIAKENGFESSPNVITILDARRTEAYMEVFDKQGKSIQKLHCALLDQTDISNLLPSVVIGDASPKAKLIWTSDKLQWLDIPLSAKYQAHIALHAFNNQQFEDLAYCSPIYLKGANGVLL